jgi:type 1 glutamine amidotransferase
MDRNLIISGGIFHDFAGTSQTLASLIAPLGVESSISEDPEAAIADLAAGGWSMLTVNALRWPMEGEKYDPWRDEWAFSLSAAGRAALTDFVADGGGLLGLHTAAICFGDWDGWRGLLGGAWRWGQSWHPAPSELAVRPTAAGAAAGLDAFAVTDERYSALSFTDGVETLLFADDEEGVPQPLAWRHCVGAGRVACDLLGHDSKSLAVPGHALALRSLVGWVLGRPASEVAA